MDIIRLTYINDCQHFRMYLTSLARLLKELGLMKILVFLNHGRKFISLSTVLYNLNYAILVIVLRAFFEFYRLHIYLYSFLYCRHSK